MCGRFTLTASDLADLARTWAAEVDAALAAAWRPRFNVAPGDHHPLLVPGRAGRRLVPAAFGLAGPGGRLLVNARVETAARLPAFAEAWRARRAVVPADGFYEWTGPAAARRPRWIHPEGGGALLLAALVGPSTAGCDGFAILTTTASAVVAPVHDRMPVVVPPDRLDAWLSGRADALAGATPATLRVTAVSTRVNAVANDDAGCLAPPEPERQGALF